MSKAKALGAALALCALAICALGAAGASAAGTTAFVCEEVEEGTGNYEDAHCETEGKGNHETVEIEEGQTTEVEGTSTVEPELEATFALIKTTITCSAMSSTSGDLKNIINEAGEHTVEGTGIVVNYTGCTVKLNGKPKAGCVVAGGEITTNPLHSTTTAEHKVTITPDNTEEIFTEITLEGCGTGISGTKPVKGKATGTWTEALHSHLTFEGTAGGELKFGGQTAKYRDTTHAVIAGTAETIGLQTV